MIISLSSIEVRQSFPEQPHEVLSEACVQTQQKIAPSKSSGTVEEDGGSQ
jgi:hypothetical protein